MKIDCMAVKNFIREAIFFAMKVEALRQRLWSGVTAEEIEMVLWFGCGLNVSPKGSYWDLGLRGQCLEVVWNF